MVFQKFHRLHIERSQIFHTFSSRKRYAYRRVCSRIRRLLIYTCCVQHLLRLVRSRNSICARVRMFYQASIFMCKTPSRFIVRIHEIIPPWYRAIAANIQRYRLLQSQIVSFRQYGRSNIAKFFLIVIFFTWFKAARHTNSFLIRLKYEKIKFKVLNYTH